MRLASPEECLAQFGYAPGTVPPVGHAAGVRVLLDAELAGLGSSCTETRAASATATTAASSCSSGSACDGTNTGSHDLAGSELLHSGAGMEGATLAVTHAQLMQLLQDAAVASFTTASREPTQAADAPGDAPAAAGPGPGSAAAGTVASPAAAAAAASSSMGAGGGAQAPATRFLLDSMLGRLCRWLRCMGVDAEMVAQGTPSCQLAALAEAAGLQVRRCGGPGKRHAVPMLFWCHCRCLTGALNVLRKSVQLQHTALARTPPPVNAPAASGCGEVPAPTPCRRAHTCRVVCL